MNNPKKSTKEFIDEIIIPIENNVVDSGNLYILIKSFTSIKKPNEFEPEHKIDDQKNWGLPIENNPGDWLEDKSINLQTLSGILWYGSWGGGLYKAEYQGEKENLSLNDHIYYGPIQSERLKLELEIQEKINAYINTGIKVKTARLKSKVGNWTPYLLASFGNDAIEHGFSLCKEFVPDIYKKGLLFSRAYAKYWFGIDSAELEEMVKTTKDDMDLFGAANKFKHELENEIDEEIKSDYPTQDIGKAIIESFGSSKPFSVANHMRTNIAHLRVKLYPHHNFPYDITGNVNETEKLSLRIWYSLMKSELDWQVSHLEK